MSLTDVAFHECRTLDDASALLVKYAPRARLLAGGTDLLVDLKAGRTSADHLISLNRIDELRGIFEVSGGLRIGALTTITQLDRSPLVRRKFPVLRDATRQMAVRQIRNVATVGGNLACAAPCADLPPVLMVLSARVTLWASKQERTIPVEDFFVNVRKTQCRENEILRAVDVPCQPDRSGAAYARFGLREGNAIAVAAVAASLEIEPSGKIVAACIALGSVAPIPTLAIQAAQALIGEVASDAIFEEAGRGARAAAKPISDVRGSAEFRRELVEVLTVRALRSAHARATEANECR